MQDKNEVFATEFFMVFKFERANLHNFEITMRVFTDNGFPISPHVTLKQPKSTHPSSNIWIFESVSLRDIMVNNVALIFNFYEKKEVHDSSNTNEILNVVK